VRTPHWFIALSLVGFTAPVFGQEATLKWDFDKLKEGTSYKSFYQEMTTETVQTMKVMNSDIKQTQKQTFYFSWTPVEKKDDNWVIKQTIEGVKMRIEIGGQPIEYDSTTTKEGGTSSALGDFFKALVKSEFRLTLDKDFKVTKIEGREEFVKKLTAANPQMEKLLTLILNEDALKQMADPTFAAVPNAAKKPNDSWEKTTKLDMGPIGTYENKYKYTYEGKSKTKDKEKLDSIKVETTLGYKPPDEKNAGVGGLPFKIKSADLTSKNASGTILFDAEKGRVVEQEMKVELNGKLTIEIGGQSTVVNLDQVQTTTVKTTDTNPITAKKP
jgi:Family of unknown function (DUF6263)